MILLHAGVADSRVWELSLLPIVRAGVRAIAYDRRGFGDSTWTAQPFSHVEDLLAVMDALELDDAVLVGSSQGGRIALDAALLAPDRVAGLVLIGTAVTGAPAPSQDLEPHEARLDAMIEELEEFGDLEGVNRCEARLWLDGSQQPQMRVKDPARRLFMAMNGRALAAPDVGDVIWPASAWDRLEDVSCTTLVATGRHDVSIVNSRSEVIADRLRDSLRWQFPRSAHLPMLDDPSTFARIIGEYLDLVGRT